MKTKLQGLKALHYENHVRFGALEIIKDHPVEDKADFLNLLEDIIGSACGNGRSADEIVESYLQGTTPKIYAPTKRKKTK